MLLLIAATVGPLQPVATELGVEVAFPQSENMVLVIQQLAANLSSSVFIPYFEKVKNAGGEDLPEYAFSFMLLSGIHLAATVYFATFKGKYERLRHEQEAAKGGGGGWGGGGGGFVSIH